MKKVNLSNISRRDWNKISSSATVNKLRYNYALQIQKTASKGKVKRFPEGAFEAMYGSEWYLQPYKKLLGVAKMMPELDAPMHTPYEFSKTEREDAKKDIARVTARKQESPYYKVAKRTFSKNELKRFVEKYSYANGEYVMNQVGYAVLGYRHMCKADKAMARKVKKMDKAMDKFLRYNGFIQNLNDGRLEEIPEYLREGIAKEYRYYAIFKAIEDDCAWRTPLTFDTFEFEQLSELLWQAYQTKWANDKNLHRAKMYKAIERYYKDKEVLEELRALDLETDRYDCSSVTKLNTKFRAMVRTVVRTKVSDDAKRNTLLSLSNTLQEKYPSCRRNGWVPTLRTKIEINL